MGDMLKLDCILYLTVPPMIFEHQAEFLPSYLMGEYDVIHNSLQKHIVIREVQVIPESFLIMLSNDPSRFEGKELFIFDFGGMTSNICRIVNLGFSVTSDYYVTLQKGMYHIDVQIAEILRNNQKIRCDYSNIDIYRNNGNNLLDSVSEEVESIYCNHIEELVTLGNIQGWDIEHGDILVSGGGAKHLFGCLQEYYFDHAQLSKDILFDNVNGLDILIKEVYGDDYTSLCC
jgi:hypothetical protein